MLPDAELTQLRKKLARQPGHPPATILQISDVPGQCEIELRPLYWRHSAFWMFLLAIALVTTCVIFAGDDILKALRRTREPGDRDLNQILLLLIALGFGFLVYTVLAMCRRIVVREHPDRVEIATVGLIRKTHRSWERGNGLCDMDANRGGRGAIEHLLYIIADGHRKLAIRGRLEDELLWVCRWLGWTMQIYFVRDIVASAERGEFNEDQTQSE